MSKVKAKLTVLALAMVLVLTLAAGGMVFARAEENAGEGTSYNDKIVARYTLDEVKDKKFAAVDKTGAAASAFDATTAGTARSVNMEGKGSGVFNKKKLTLPKTLLGATDTAFSISGWLNNTGNDWNVFLNAGNYKIGLPNLDPWVIWDKNNMTPLPENKFNGHEWDTFKNEVTPSPTSNALNDFVYLTVTVDASAGITFYKNGVKAFDYPATKTFPNGKTVADFVTGFITEFKANGASFAEGNIDAGIIHFDDLIFSSALTEAESAAIYADKSSLTIQKIATADTVIKVFTQATAIAGVPSSDPEYKVNYVINTDGGDADANRPVVTFTAAAFGTESTTTEGVTTVTPVLKPLTADDITVTSTDGTPSVDTTAKTTTTPVTYTIINKATGARKTLVINFLRNDDLTEAEKTLTEIKVDGTLIKGFTATKLSYDYALAATAIEIPAVTYKAMIANNVIVELSDTAEFDGKTFAYEIKIYKKNVDAKGELLNTYTVNFTRATSAVVKSVSLDGAGFYGFNDTKYSDGTQATEQNAYVHSYVTDVKDIVALRQFTDVSELNPSVIDTLTHKITVSILDKVSNETKTYVLNQILFDETADTAYDIDLNATKLTQKGEDTFYSDAKGAIKTFGSTHVAANNLSLGATGYFELNLKTALGATALNSDGITLSTWMRLDKASVNEWAGAMAVHANKTLIVNNNQVLTGDYNGGWVNDGSQADSTRFVSETYKHVTLVLTGKKAILYVDGALITAKDASVLTVSNSMTISFGRSGSKTELLGNGDYKEFTVYNAPLSGNSVATMYSKMDAGLLTALKFEGETVNVQGFSPKNFNSYDLTKNSAIVNPTATDFPTLLAENAESAVSADDITLTISGQTGTYTIISSAGGFSYTYTVKLTLADSNTLIESARIQYKTLVNDSITGNSFTNNNGAMEYTYKVWKGCDLSKFVVTIAIGDQQSIEDESMNKANGTYTFTVYAADNSHINYVIRFVEDESIVDPEGGNDAGEPEPEKKKGCQSQATAGVLGAAFIALCFAGAMLFIGKKKANKNK